jgi:hypothetical protein
MHGSVFGGHTRSLGKFPVDRDAQIGTLIKLINHPEVQGRVIVVANLKAAINNLLDL